MNFNHILDLASFNHPVHIITKENKTSPSAFIPFCEFGKSMSRVGVKHDNFEVPVCNSFEATIFNDQLCYEIDLNRFSMKNNLYREIKAGFTFIMDYNEDRQVDVDPIEEKHGLFNHVSLPDNQEDASIHLNTIGICNFFWSF